MSDDLDFRVRCGLFDHPKWMRLDDALGDKGTMALMRLWGWARRHRDRGDLSGLSDAEIARAARWRGAAGRLVGLLAEIGWLDGSEGARRLHDWIDHQPHAANTKGFQRAQRLKAVARHAKEAGMTAEQYSRYSFGISLDDYLSNGGTCRTGAGYGAGHMPGKVPGTFDKVPPPSSPLPPTHPPTQGARAETAPGAPADPAPGGIGLAPGVPPSDPQAGSPAGRSLRLPDPPDPAKTDDPAEAQARAAHRLELTLGCSYVAAAKAVAVVANAGATIEWITERIRTAKPPQPPWEWQDAACAAWAAAGQKPWVPLLGKASRPVGAR